MLSTEKKLLTAEEVADFLGVKVSAIYHMTHSGTIPFVSFSRRMIRFKESDILAWIAEKSKGKANREKENGETRSYTTRKTKSSRDADIERLVEKVKTEVIKNK